MVVRRPKKKKIDDRAAASRDDEDEKLDERAEVEDGKLDERAEEEDEDLESPELLKPYLIYEQMELQYKRALSKIEEFEGRVSRRDYLIDSQNALLIAAEISLVVPEATQEPLFLESESAE